MLVHWVLLATVLLSSAVTPNLGAPSVNHESLIGSRAPSVNPESLIDSGAPAVDPESLVDSAESSIDSEAPAGNQGEDVATQKSRGIFGFGGSPRKKPSVLGQSISSSDVYNTHTLTTTKNGQCVTEITITGKGIDDTLEYPCSATGMSSYASQDDLLLTRDTPKIDSIFGKQPGKLQVIRDGECSVRTYTTANGKTTASSTPVGRVECDAMKEEHAQRLEQWNKWEDETFPPCFPFCDTDKPSDRKKKPNKNPKPSAGNGNSPSSASGSSNLLNMASNPSASTSQETPAPNQSSNQLLGALKQLMDYMRKAFSRRELLDDPSQINSA